MAALHALLEVVAGGAARTLLIDGETGVGKTTLIERFVADLPDARVLSAYGDESEARIRFAIADQLLRSAGVKDANVLQAADHVGVGMALLEQLSHGGDGPTLVVVDDAHEADPDSLRALLFCARRLVGVAALIVLIVRGAAAEALPEGWSKLTGGPEGDRLHLAPLTAGQTRALGAELELPLSRSAAQRLWEHTAGNPLYTRAVLGELPSPGAWPDDLAQLPAPRAYARLIEARLRRCPPDVAALLGAASVLGVRAPLDGVFALANLAEPLAALDAATESGLVAVEDRGDGAWLEFTHPLTRAAVQAGLPRGRRSALHLAAAQVAPTPQAALHHRVAAATVPDPGLQAELETTARAEIARGAWAAAVTHLRAASRLAVVAEDRERLALEAIEALLYAGDGGAARRLAERTQAGRGPRRDSVWALLASFAGDVDTAERRLARAWDHRREGDDRLAATIAQRRAFVAASRLRGGQAVEWARRAVALAPDDVATALLAAPSLALGLSFGGRPLEARAELDRRLADRDAPPPGSGFVLLAIKAQLLAGAAELEGAAVAFERSARAGVEDGMHVVAALSLSGLARVQYLSGSWDDAVVSAERAVPLAVESEDRWVVAHARLSAALVPLARGAWDDAEAIVRAIEAEPAAFERHVALRAIAVAALAAAQGRAGDVLDALAPLQGFAGADGLHDHAFQPWHHLWAQALVDKGRHEEAERFTAATERLAAARAQPLLAARLENVRGRLAAARQETNAAVAAFGRAREILMPLGMPYEQALVELAHGQLLRREGKRRLAATLLECARERLAGLSALPALARCERELAACGLAPTARSARDHARLTPQETAVARLVVSGMSNRQVADELMLSTKTVEFHLSNVYFKLGVRSRADLRARDHGL